MNPNLKVILIRGLPGSGKSTLAEMILESFFPEMRGWHEADHFFEKLGKFDPSKLQEAHELCKLNFEKDLLTFLAKDFNSCVIVSNTFTQKWEMQPYLDLCKNLGIEPQIITCKGNFKSVHNVPEATIEKMRQRWED